MKKIAILSAFSLFLFSCYPASEATRYYVTNPNHSLTYENTPLTAKGLGAATAFNIVGGLLLSSIANAHERANIESLVYLCEKEKKREFQQDCVNWAKVKWQEASEFNNRLNCTFFSKCWNKALDYANALPYESLDKALYSIEFNYTYASCMPSNIESISVDELNHSYQKCTKEADEKAEEFVKNAQNEIKRYNEKEGGG